MSNTTQYFSNTAHFTHYHVMEDAHIGMNITTSTDSESVVVPLSSFISQFSLGKKLVVITSDVGTNLSICKAILESNFDNTGVFYFGKAMFVMECLPHVL